MVDPDRFSCHFDDLQTVDFAAFDGVVPLKLPDYKAINSNKIFSGTKYLSPDPGIVELCDDKLALNRWLLGGQFAGLVPPLLEPNDSPYPYVLKKRHDVWGMNSFVIRNSEDERAIASLLQSPDYFRQRYISGTVEYALHVLMTDSEVAYAQTVKYEMDRLYCVKGKYAPEARRVYLAENDHLATFMPVLKALGFVGTCCIDYKIENGAPMLFEINPRAGASLTKDINRFLDAYLGHLGAEPQLRPN